MSDNSNPSTRRVVLDALLACFICCGRCKVKSKCIDIEIEPTATLSPPPSPVSPLKP